MADANYYANLTAQTANTMFGQGTPLASMFYNAMRQESLNFNPDVVEGRHRSSAGAIGIAQFMPDTARQAGVDPLNPQQALTGAANYIKQLLGQFGNDPLKAFAAYNYGPGNMSRIANNPNWQDQLPAETRSYISIVSNGVANIQKANEASAPVRAPLPGHNAPVQGSITSGFGNPYDMDSGYDNPVTGQHYEHFNKGYDFGVPLGTPVGAVVGGTVIAAVPEQSDTTGWGNHVWIRDQQGVVHNYGHLSQINVKQGDTVNEGQIIALSGNSGHSSGPHLSYDIWKETPNGNLYLDPAEYLGGQSTTSYTTNQQAGGSSVVNQQTGTTNSNAQGLLDAITARISRALETAYDPTKTDDQREAAMNQVAILGSQLKTVKALVTGVTPADPADIARIAAQVGISNAEIVERTNISNAGNATQVGVANANNATSVQNTNTNVIATAGEALYKGFIDLYKSTNDINLSIATLRQNAQALADKYGVDFGTMALGYARAGIEQQNINLGAANNLGQLTLTAQGTAARTGVDLTAQGIQAGGYNQATGRDILSTIKDLYQMNPYQSDTLPGYEPGGPESMIYQSAGLQYDPNKFRMRPFPIDEQTLAGLATRQLQPINISDVWKDAHDIMSGPGGMGMQQPGDQNANLAAAQGTLNTGSTTAASAIPMAAGVNQATSRVDQNPSVAVAATPTVPTALANNAAGNIMAPPGAPVAAPALARAPTPIADPTAPPQTADMTTSQPQPKPDCGPGRVAVWKGGSSGWVCMANAPVAASAQPASGTVVAPPQ